MDSVGGQAYREVDPNKKNAEWATREVTLLRMFWRPIIDQNTARINKSILFSQQDMSDVKGMFKDKKFIENTRFEPLGFMESIRNSMIEELTKMPPKVKLKATDPDAIRDRKRDLQLLKTRKLVEGDISQYNQQIGLPPHKVDYKNYKGNIEEFDSMGLDENDPDDVNFYEQEYQALNYEIAGQSVINNVMKLIRFDEETIKKFVNDMLANKRICMQVFVDKITGEIKGKHLFPEVCYGILGDSSNGDRDICDGWQDSVTVMEWLEMVGNEFDWDAEWKYLLWAINYTQGNKYTGFRRNGIDYDCFNDKGWMSQMGMASTEKSTLCDWSMAYNFKVFMGYLEWTSMDATANYLKKKNDPNFLDIVPYSYDLKKKKQVKEYQIESWYQEQKYGCYFLATGVMTQRIYNFGKVYFQQLHGSNDQYAAGTLMFYREEGKSAVEIAAPYINLGSKVFYKFLWAVYKAKPEEDVYIYEELIQVAKSLQRAYPQTATPGQVPTIDNIISQAIQYQKENTIRIRSYPQIDGKTVQQLPPLEGKKNGIDSIAAQMLQTLQWVEQKIAYDIGWNPMRSGANPPARESTNTENNIVQSSYNSTGYIYRMIQYLKQKAATTVLTYTQDIIKFKDSLPYKWLLTLVGNDNFNALSLLDDFCPHRYGMFMEDDNTGSEKQRIMQAADLAFQKGQIKVDAWGVINKEKDPNKALKILSFLERKAEKRARAQQIQDVQMAQQTQQMAFQQQKDLIVTKGMLDLRIAEKQTEGQKYSADAQAQSRIQVKQLTNEAEAPKQEAKAQGAQQVLATKKNLEEQEPMVSE